MLAAILLNLPEEEEGRIPKKRFIPEVVDKKKDDDDVAIALTLLLSCRKC